MCTHTSHLEESFVLCNLAGNYLCHGIIQDRASLNNWPEWPTCLPNQKEASQYVCRVIGPCRRAATLISTVFRWTLYIDESYLKTLNRQVPGTWHRRFPSDSCLICPFTYKCPENFCNKKCDFKREYNKKKVFLDHFLKKTKGLFPTNNRWFTQVCLV